MTGVWELILHFPKRRVKYVKTISAEKVGNQLSDLLKEVK